MTTDVTNVSGLVLHQNLKYRPIFVIPGMLLYASYFDWAKHKT